MSEGMTFYRCMTCSGIVSQWDIRDHGACPTCEGVRIRPTNLTLWEKLVQIIKHPRIWEWSDDFIRPDESG